MEPRADGVSKPRSLALEKMETLVRQMQSTDSGVPVRCQKLFLTTIPSAFMGYDLIEWLMENLPIDDSAEALHLASLLCQHGYFFPVGDAKTLQVKDDSSLYRFQTPYYWPSRNHVPDSTDYAIYLHKKIAKNKQKHGLEDCELEGYNQLKKTLASKWDFVTMQADEQLKMAKDRKKGDKIVSESQERAYWRVYRPPPGFTNTLEMPPVPDRSRQSPGGSGSSVAVLSRELSFMRLSLGRLRIKISQVAESTLAHHETYLELDPFLSPVQPSNPWHTDDPTFMELNEPLVEFPTERRVRRWAISMEETVSDPTGLHEFTACMRKEFSHENIRFWSAVHQLRKMPLSQVPDEVRSIYDEFLRPGAPCEINIDGKTMERTQELLKNPTRFTYDCAADHIFDLLLKKDCYPRFLRSEHYKNLLTNATNPTSKKRFFTFGAPGKKKISSVTPPNISQLVASSGRLSSEDQSAVATSVGGGGAKPDCDPPYRGDILARDRPRPVVATLREEDAGIFLGGPATPPPSARVPPALSPSPSPCPARPSSDVTGPMSSALVPVSASASAVVPYTPARHPSGPAPASVSAPLTTAYSSSTLPASAAASSSASTTASTSSSTTAAAAPPSTTSSTLSSTSTPAAIPSAGESSGLSSASKDNSQGSVSVTAPASSASGSVASAVKATPAGSASALTRAGSAAAAGTDGESAGPSSARAASASSAATATAVASASAWRPTIEAGAEDGSVMPPVEPSPSVGLAASEAAGAPEGDPAKDVELTRPGDVAVSPSASAAGGGDSGAAQTVLRRTAELPDSLSASCREQGAAGSSGESLCPPPPTAGDAAGDSPPVWTAAIAPPAMFQDSAAPLATIDERDESTPPPPPALPPPLSPPGKAGSPPSASALASRTAATAAAVAGAAETAGTVAAGAVAGSGSASAAPPSATPHTEIVKLTDRCAQTVETGDSVDYGSTTDKQCEANLPRERGTRRKEKRVKICETPTAAAVTGTSTAGGEAAATDEAAKRRSRSASADTKRERKESRARREPRKKSSSERRRARLEDGELEGASPKRGDVVAPAAGEPAPQKLDESSVCPWENDLPTPTWL